MSSTKRKIKKAKRRLVDESFVFTGIQKGYFKRGRLVVVLPVLCFTHNTYLNDFGNRLSKMVVIE